MNSKSELQRVSGHQLRGYRSIYQKELAYWFGTRRWLVQLIVWTTLTTLPAISITPPGNDRGVSLLSLFLGLGTAPMQIGTIVIAQAAIIQEKLTETLLWICSKPLSRAALILAKFSAYAVFVSTIVLGVPAILAFAVATAIGLSPQVTLFQYFVSVGMIDLLLLFSLALTLMLGTLINSTGAVCAIALFVVFGGATLNVNPQLQRLEAYSFWALQRYAIQILIGEFPAQAWGAIASTIVLVGVWLWIATWRMRQYEL